MKRIILIALMGFVFTNVAFPQKGWDKKKLIEAVEKAEKEHNAQQKGTKEPKNNAEKAKQSTEQAKTNQQTQQLKNQFDKSFQKQMNSLNQTTAEDYMNPPLEQGNSYSTKSNKFGETQQMPKVVAKPKTATGIRSWRFAERPWDYSHHEGGSNAEGVKMNMTAKKLETTDNRGYHKPNMLITPQHTQPQLQHQKQRVSSNEMRNKFQKPGRAMYQGVINTKQTNIPTRASFQRPPQQNNTQNVGSAQAQRARGTQKTQQASNQQRTAQNIASTHMPQKREVPIREQVGANRIVNIDSSKGINPKTGQNNSSSDLRPVDILKPGEANGRKAKYTAYNIPNEARHLSDTDNKTLSTYTGSGRTMAQQYSLMNKDRMNGFASFDNPREWDYIYGVYNAGTVRTTSRVVTQTR